MKIKEVSQKYDLSVDTLRYYEKEGLIPPVPRNASGLREYDEASCRFIELVKTLRSAGMPIEVLSHFVALCHRGDVTLPDRLEILRDVRAAQQRKLEEIRAGIERLDRKIGLYDEKIAAVQTKH